MSTWVIQSSGVTTRHTLKLINILKELGEPFVDTGINKKLGIFIKPDESLGKNLMPYGSVTLVKLAQEEGWKYNFFDEKTFRVDAWLENRSDMVNSDSEIMSLSEVKAVANRQENWFIRPLHDLKDFSGHVISSSELISWIENLEVGDCELTGAHMACISRPKNIQMEWRYFIVDGKIVTGSSYRFKGQFQIKEEKDPEVLAEAQKLADIWLPHECVCMDVALVDNEVKVLEFNGLNASGFYDHDIRKFVQAISKYMKEH